MQSIIIPDPLQITMDDIGWFCGKDGREKMEPARTGINRRHCALDYEVINEIGRRLNMKINCAMIIGEWDSDNRLKNIPGLSPYGENWDNASFFNKDEAKKCADVINSSEYIDVSVHGLQHTYYTDGKTYNNTDYYYMEENEWHSIPENEIRARLDAFYNLMEHSGIKKNVNSFIPPNFTYRMNHLSKILKDYGILYISTKFDTVIGADNIADAVIEDGIITIDRNNNLIPWFEMESDLSNLPVTKGVFGCHWANVCHNNPMENYKLADNWVNYFEKCKSEFGIILSKDIAFCATQTIYKKYCKILKNNDAYTIDLTNIPKADGLGKSFYVSCKKPLAEWVGCEAEIYEKCGNFINYKITPNDKIITLA